MSAIGGINKVTIGRHSDLCAAAILLEGILKSHDGLGIDHGLLKG
jgi:hypothetical protein